MASEARRYAKRLKLLFMPKKLFPIIEWLPKYKASFIPQDLICGISLGLMVIPQSFAYAQLAALPPQYGLYTSYIGVFIYILMGSALHINMGTAAVMSLLTGNFILQAISTLPVQYQTDASKVIYSAFLTFWNGIFVFLMGFFGLGLMVNFFSIPVNVGYTSACSIVICASQLSTILGIPGPPRDTIPRIVYAFDNITKTNFWDLGIALIGITFLLTVEFGGSKILEAVLKKLKPESKSYRYFEFSAKFFITCRYSLWTICVTVTAYVLTSQYHKPITIIGPMPSGIFCNPNFFSIINHNASDNGTTTVLASTLDLFSNLGIGLGIMPLITMVSQFAIGRSLGRRAGYRMDASNELLAIGFMNTLGSFFGAYPTSGSITRSALVYQIKPKSLLYNLVQAVMVLLALYFITGVSQFIPKAALSAQIVCALIEMFEYKMWIKLAKKSPFELIPLLVTFITAIAWAVDYGIILGLVFSVVLYLLPITNFPFFVNYEEVGTYRVTIVTMRQMLKFVSLDRFVGKMTSIVKRDVLPVIVDCTFVTAIDFTGLEGLLNMLNSLHNTGHKLLFVNMMPKIKERIENFGVKHFIHYDTMEDAFEKYPFIVKMQETESATFDNIPRIDSDATFMRNSHAGFGALDQGKSYQDDDEIVLSYKKKESRL